MRKSKIQINAKFQIPNPKQIGVLLLSGICCLALGASLLFGREDLEVLKDIYFHEHKYTEFIDYLKDLQRKDPSSTAQASYYIALCRYHQLKHLEDNQNWDEYFSKGNAYRNELVNGAERVIGLTSSEDSLNLYAHCLLWQFHKDQEDVFVQDALKDLMGSAVEYADKKDDLKPIKYIADRLHTYGVKLDSKKLYRLYVDKLLVAQTEDEELKKAAQEAFNEGNLSLSITIYDVYIERIIESYPPHKSIPVLMAIARDFSYKDKANSDPEYAERIFRKIDGLGAGDSLDEETLYSRAYNLEKSKHFSEAQEKYIRLIKRFPQTSHYSEALFKCGIISTYVLTDVDLGFDFFEKLANSSDVNPYVISGIYQLGLLSQWKKDFAKAKAHYTRLIQLAGERFGDTQELAEQRLKELEKDGEIEYNLKIFLDASLQGNFDMTKVDLKSQPYKLSRDKDAFIIADTFLPQSGCMTIETNYLWSGHLGKLKAPRNQQSQFSTSYVYPGTKEINLIVVSPSGILDRIIGMIDVE